MDPFIGGSFSAEASKLVLELGESGVGLVVKESLFLESLLRLPCFPKLVAIICLFFKIGNVVKANVFQLRNFLIFRLR